MSSVRPTIVGIVLAAGAARRMGRPKQLLPLGGRPVLQHVVDAAAASSLAETVVVLGHAADEVRAAVAWPAGCRFVVNDRWADGQSASLRAGLAALGPEVAAALVLLGDQPEITATLIDTLTEAFDVARDGALRPVWIDDVGSRVPGHPVVLGRRLWPAVMQLSGDAGARALFVAHPEWVHEVAMTGSPPHDLDDLDDYQRAVTARAARA